MSPSSSAEAAASASWRQMAANLRRARSRSPTERWFKALARAWCWQGMLEEGRFTSVRELAEAERVSSYISRILRLTCSHRTSPNGS
jgi:hypothetical protein